MRDDDRLLASWAGIVDAIMRGEGPRRPLVTLGPTPRLLQSLGLAPSDLMMATGKVARCRRDHPQVSLKVWHDLPRLIETPIAVLPSVRRDESLVAVLVVTDANGDPILVPIMPGAAGSPNIILSVYGKAGGTDWIRKQIGYAVADDLPHYVGKGFVATLPQPGSALAIPSSPGPIPVDGTTKLIRSVLTIRRNVKDSGDDEQG